MKDLYAKDVVDKIQAIWPNVETRKVEKIKDGWDVEIANMYEAPGLELSQLIELAEFFGTKNIESAGNFSNGGCETCDYGSSYGFTLQIRD